MVPVLLTLALALAATADPAVSPLVLDELPPDDALAESLWQRAPELAQARAQVAAARAELGRAETLPNPQLDLGWNTIPVGQTNPPGLSSPMSQIPNYVAGVSELFEIGKRGPRQRAARYASDAVLLASTAQLKQAVLAVVEAAGRVAAAQARVAALTDLAADAGSLTALQRVRAERGDVADLDLARAQLDEQKFRASLADARQKLALALTECAAAASAPCQPFGTAEKARAFLETRATLPANVPAAAIAERPDVRALEAQARSARAAEELGRARAIPDVTLRVAFTYDQFVVSGNQEKSFSVGAAIPIPLFERGRNDAAQAAAAAESAEVARNYLLAQANRELPVLLAQAAELQQRRTTMKGEIVPLARSVVERLDAVVRVGGASIQDVLLARRTLGEVLLDSIDLDLTALQLALQVRRVSAPAPSIPGTGTGPRT